MPIKTVGVYCGSKVGRDPSYQQAAIELADYFVDNDIQLVNGGGKIGLMGVMADRILERGGKCIGVIPLGLRDKELAHTGMTELIVTPDMHSRKMTMVKLSDAFIALPGGIGTMDEFFETLTWSRLDIHHKPVGLLNVNGFYDPIVTMADRMLEEGFLRPEGRSLMKVSDSVEGLFAQMAE